MRASGPKIYPPDCETARACLMRRFFFHSGNAKAFWMPAKFKALHGDRAAELANAICIFALYEDEIQPKS